MITLRPYQVEASNDAISCMVDRGLSFCLCLPAQTGKTITVFEIVRKMLLKHYGMVTLFVTPRKFITKQGSDEAIEFFNESDVGYINSKIKTEKQIKAQTNDKKIVVADLKTTINRLKKYPFLIKMFGLLVADEAHYSNKKEEQESISLVEELRGLMKHCYQLGVTATPHDENGKYMDTYDVIYDKFNTAYMVKNGYLAETIPYIASIYLDNKQAYNNYQNTLRHGSKGEITAGSLAKATNSKAGKILTDAMIKTSLKDGVIGFSERALVYTGSIEQSEIVCREYRQRGLKAVTVHSKMKNNLDIVDGFNKGIYDILISVDMLIMGVVIKNVKKSLFFRDIGSWITYIQVWNRGRGGNKEQTRMPNKLYFFTETYNKKGHADDFAPHNNDKEKKADSKCIKCNSSKKDFPFEVIKEVQDGNFVYVQKRCIVCGLLEESSRATSLEQFYNGTFNLVPAERKKQIIQKARVAKNDFAIGDAILKINNLLITKKFPKSSADRIVSYLNNNARNKLAKDPSYLRKVFNFVSKNNSDVIFRDIVGVVQR